MIEITLAQMTKLAAQIHEDSWKDDSNHFLGGSYTISLYDACDKAALEFGYPKLGRLLQLSLGSWWNDTLDWANEILEN